MLLHEMKFGELLDAIAAKSPTPGGGAVAAMTCALGASLAQMVLQYSIGKKSLAAHDELHQRTFVALRHIRARALELAEADAAAYARLNELWRLKEDDPRRKRDFPSAVEAAIDPPRQMLQDARELVRLLEQVCGKTSASLNSDLAIAAVLAASAARAAAWNVRINLSLLDDQRKRQELHAVVAAMVEESRLIAESIERSCDAG